LSQYKGCKDLGSGLAIYSHAPAHEKQRRTESVAGTILGKDIKSIVLGALAGPLWAAQSVILPMIRRKNREETQQTYNYKPDYSTVLTPEDVSSQRGY
jgi:hypothetical protein